MAGIRGVKNPLPDKTTPAKGIFKQRGSAGSFMHRDMVSNKADKPRKGPTSGRNSGTSAGKSHYNNMGLKKGTAK